MLAPMEAEKKKRCSDFQKQETSQKKEEDENLMERWNTERESPKQVVDTCQKKFTLLENVK